ncbi:MAG: hypothetical protein J2P31_08330 [Blastocatellia bacterium]|nr:hypothetical protein [Blastocatellia bacterium]
MNERNIFQKREYWLEEVYFRKRDQELVEKLHRRRARQAENRQMAEIAGVSDQDVIDALQDLGYTAKTVQLLYFVPLVQVAWSEGGVADRERATILNLASTRGIEAGSIAQQQLIQWLTVKPSEQFFEDNLHAIRVIFASLPPEQRESRRQQLLDSCHHVASAVEGGIMGRAQISESEHLLIDHIVREIDNG